MRSLNWFHRETPVRTGSQENGFHSKFETWLDGISVCGKIALALVIALLLAATASVILDSDASTRPARASVPHSRASVPTPEVVTFAPAQPAPTLTTTQVVTRTRVVHSVIRQVTPDCKAYLELVSQLYTAELRFASIYSNVRDAVSNIQEAIVMRNSVLLGQIRNMLFTQDDKASEAFVNMLDLKKRLDSQESVCP